MMHDKESTAWPIRKSFLIDPALRVRLIFEYPFFVGRNIEEVLRTTRALQLHDETGAATPADWDQGDLVIIPDKRPEAEVLRQFQAESQHLTSYLRVVENRRGGSVPQD
jgi:peroxiredoxin (alkyl hydroperoxide reductase subunit C)